MSRYVKVATKFWTDEKVRKLSEDARELYLYILTSPHSNMAGYYRLPKAYIAEDLYFNNDLAKGLERVSKGLKELIENGLIRYCESSSVVLICNFFKYNSIQNKNQAKGVNNKISELPENRLTSYFIRACKDYADNYIEELTKGLPKPSRKGSGNTETETVTETVYNNNSCSDSDESNDDINNPDDQADSKNQESNPPVATEEEEPKFDQESPPFKASCYLRKRILENNKRARVPDPNPSDMEDWATEIDRLNRLGPIGAKESDNKGYSWQEIREIIDWCQDDNFWKSNILSAGKLREQIVKLENQMRNRASPKESKQAQKDDMLRKLYAKGG
ncbi:hypothetical protein [Fuchsiella alkaliacetigena]|uniref:hypothetical protein n=1 Tax=Fuchsiella alkaliacetigena TaxID=957042 RepID=UPI00200B2943|nr:hypothetical protein [Fuchsiella alkaliacetigena]MCK8824709.1 hypothetical protein [Fuchsiella alkaliacetigena]